MSGRQDKKIRQLFRKQVRHSAEDIGRKLGNALKPKPKFVPTWLWLKLLSIFIEVRRDR